MDAQHQLVKLLRPGDVIGHRQQSEQQVYEVINVDAQRVLVARPPRLCLRFILLKDIAPPF